METTNKRQFKVHCQNLSHPDDPDAALIPVLAWYYVKESKHISEEQVQRIAYPKKLFTIAAGVLELAYAPEPPALQDDVLTL